MTPQLMQAIKLLQLSNLDLSAFVEEELSEIRCSNANDGTEPPVAATAGTGRIFRPRRYGFRLWRRRCRRAVRTGQRFTGDGFEPVQEEWMNSDLGSRAEIEQTWTPASTTCFPRSRRGRRAQRKTRRRRVHRMGRGAPTMTATTRSLRRRRDHARQPPRRAAGGGLYSPAQRMIGNT